MQPSNVTNDPHNSDWYDGFEYAGESIDELIAKEGKHQVVNILYAIAEGIYEKQKRGPIRKEEAYVPAILALDGQVNNGGFAQFLLETPQHADIILEALWAIDCPKTLEITRRVVLSLGIKGDLTKESLDRALLEEEHPKYDEVVKDCEHEFFNNEEPIFDRLFDWIKRNRDKIQIGNR